MNFCLKIIIYFKNRNFYFKNRNFFCIVESFIYFNCFVLMSDGEKFYPFFVYFGLKFK
jgi:hypothetical protein